MSAPPGVSPIGLAIVILAFWLALYYGFYWRSLRPGTPAWKTALAFFLFPPMAVLTVLAIPGIILYPLILAGTIITGEWQGAAIVAAAAIVHFALIVAFTVIFDEEMKP